MYLGTRKCPGKGRQPLGILPVQLPPYSPANETEVLLSSAGVSGRDLRPAERL